MIESRPSEMTAVETETCIILNEEKNVIFSQRSPTTSMKRTNTNCLICVYGSLGHRQESSMCTHTQTNKNKLRKQFKKSQNL